MLKLHCFTALFIIIGIKKNLIVPFLALLAHLTKAQKRTLFYSIPDKA